MSVQVGLSNLVYATLTSDPVGGTATWDTPVSVPGIIQANINPNASIDTLFYDDGPGETAATTGQISVEIIAADLPLSVQAVWLGHTISNGIIERGANDTPPWLAIGFKSLKSNGKYRYTWLYKGKFSQPEQKNETKGDKINFQTPTITGNFVKLDSTGKWIRQGDEDEAGFTAGSTWFNSPSPTPDITAPTISSSTPADAATGVATNATITWTFSEPIMDADVIGDNFVVFEDATGTAVTGTLAKSGSNITFTPGSALTASTAYRFIAMKGIRDLSGNKLAATSIRKFTTA